MAVTKTYDIIIAGAGAAGLSLVWYLMQSDKMKDKSILLLDRSLKPNNEKTWCFWDDKHLPMKGLIHHSWDLLEVIAHGNTFTEELQNYSYRCMRSVDFSTTILERAADHPTVDLLEADINEFDHSGNHGTVHTSKGTYQADWIFQSALKPPGFYDQKVDISLKQHFLGVEIETKEPIFDPNKVTLMDFDTSQKHGLTFFYVLPFSETKALVEYTFFTENILSDEEYRAGIDTHLLERYSLGKSDYTISREEKGAIPMEDRHYPAWYNPRVMNIGTVGGLTKPSTGYTFTRIHRHCASIVNALEKGQEPPTSNSSTYRFRVYDMMLLSILNENPIEGVRIFRELFKRNSFDKILKFLEEKTHFGDEIAIFSSLPYTPFFKAIYKMKHRILTGA